jgi:hypothetical protein
MPDQAGTAVPIARGCCGRHLREAIARSKAVDRPFRHWLLRTALPPAMAEALASLPIQPAPIGDTAGKRETHNRLRVYFDQALQARFPVARNLALMLQGAKTTRTFEEHCGIALAGTYLRIEFCQDSDGFWLEPHTDIGVKKLTMLVYLSEGPGSQSWGTDIYDDRHRLVARAPYGHNRGLFFTPADDTWHGFDKRPIAGLRRSIIVNFVGPEWRSRGELAFPDQPV